MSMSEVMKAFEGDLGRTHDNARDIIKNGYQVEAAKLEAKARVTAARLSQRSTEGIAGRALAQTKEEFVYGKEGDIAEAKTAGLTGAALVDGLRGRVAVLPDGPSKDQFTKMLDAIPPGGVDNDVANTIRGMLDQSAGGEAMQQYDLYKRQGGDDDFTKWFRENKEAGVQPLEDWERRARLENTIKLDNAFIGKKEDDFAAQTTLWRKIAAMESLLSDPDFSSGTITAEMAPLLLAIADILPGLFSDTFRAKLVKGEMFQSGVMSIYTTLTEALKGAISDLEGGKAAMGNLQYSKDEVTNRYLFSLQKNAFKRNGAEVRFLRRENTIRRTDKDGKVYYMNALDAQHEWDKKIARGDPETVPLSYNTDTMSLENLRANALAGNLKVGDYVVRTVDGKLVPTRIIDNDHLNVLLGLGGTTP